MIDYIKLVQNDTRPSLTVTLTDENTGAPINITGCTLALKFRAAGASVLTATLVGTVLSGEAGLGIFRWSSVPDVLAGAPGKYEGEVEVTFPDGTVQTGFDILKFKMRQEF